MNSTFQNLKDEAIRQLNDKGFRTIVSQVRVPGDPYLVDAVVFESGADGCATTSIIVELERPRRKAPMKPRSCSNLLRAQQILGAKKVLIFDGEWSELNQDGTISKMPQESLPNGSVAKSLVLREPLLTRVLVQRMLQEELQGAKRLSADSAQDAITVAIANAFSAISSGKIDVETECEGKLQLDPALARRSLISLVPRLNRNSFFVTDPSISDLMAALISPGVYESLWDPFVGLGGNILSIDSLEEIEVKNIRAGEVDESVANITEAVFKSLATNWHIDRSDSFTTSFDSEFDLVSTTPPAGSLLEKWTLLLDNKTKSKKSEVVALDMSLRALKQGGRCIIQVPYNLTFARSLEDYRKFLATNFKVSALISLPGESNPGTHVPSVILVIDKCAPGETFVAQLGTDWREQVDSGSGFVVAAQQHLRGER